MRRPLVFLAAGDNLAALTPLGLRSTTARRTVKIQSPENHPCDQSATSTPPPPPDLDVGPAPLQLRPFRTLVSLPRASLVVCARNLSL